MYASKYNNGLRMHRCDKCGRQFDEDELIELEHFQGIQLQNLCSKCLGRIFVGRSQNEILDYK